MLRTLKIPTAASQGGAAPTALPLPAIPHAIVAKAQSHSSAHLRLESVSVRFDALVALEDVCLELQRREVLGVIGPNGAGKTTLVNCLSGFQVPTSGKVLLGTRDYRGRHPRVFRREGVARTFQAGRMFRNLSVHESVMAPALAAGASMRDARDQSDAVLQWCGLLDKRDQLAGVLAYTDERRLGIARALVTGPAFVLLDEPAAGMSDAECDELMRYIAQMPKLFGCGVLLIEHNMHVVMNLADRIQVMDGGRTLATGTPAQIRGNRDVLSAYLGEAP